MLLSLIKGLSSLYLEPHQICTMEPFGLTIFAKKLHVIDFRLGSKCVFAMGEDI